jgi:hypothetical protein
MPLLAMLLLSFIMQAGPIGGLHFWWENTGKYLERPQRSSQALLRPLVVEVELTQADEDERDDKESDEEESDEEEELKPEEEVAEPEPVKPADKKVVPQPESEEQRKVREEKKRSEDYAKKVDKVRSSTILMHLQSKGDGEGTGYEDALAEGVTAKKLEDAFNTDGVRIAEAGERNQFVGGPRKVEEGGTGFKRLSSNEIAGPKVGTVTTEEKAEVKVKAKVGGTLGEGIGTGKLDKASVTEVFSRRRSAIRYCYEKVLRVSPATQGKVTIRFTIGPAGRVTDIDVIANTTNNGEIAECIVDKVKGWRFPKPESGSVTYTYPFILSKAN